MTEDRLDARTLLAVGTTLVFWASAFAGIRAGLEAYGPGQVALLRFLTASAVLAVYALVTRMRLPRAGDVPAIVLAGFLGITVYHVALSFGERTVTAGAASLLIAAGPIFTAMLAGVFLGERLTLAAWGGIALSFVGVALIALGEGEGLRFESDALLVLLAALSTSMYFVFQKPYLARYGALEFAAYAIWAGTVFMLPFAPGLVRQLPSAPLAPTAAVVYLGVFPAALAYVTWTYALSRAGASRITTFLYLSPVLAIAIAWVWLGEVPGLLSVVGGALAVAGVVVVNSQRKGGRRRISGRMCTKLP